MKGKLTLRALSNPKSLSQVFSWGTVWKLRQERKKWRLPQTKVRCLTRAMRIFRLHNSIARCNENWPIIEGIEKQHFWHTRAFCPLLDTPGPSSSCFQWFALLLNWLNPLNRLTQKSFWQWLWSLTEICAEYRVKDLLKFCFFGDKFRMIVHVSKDKLFSVVNNLYIFSIYQMLAVESFVSLMRSTVKSHSSISQGF